jgi:hypothetical protein
MVESRSRLFKTGFKYNKAPGPETFQAELIKTMPTEQLKVLQRWFNEILVTDETLTKVTEQEMTGKQVILHKGGPLVNLTFHCRPVVLLNITKQLITYVVNERIIEMGENAVILTQVYDGF